MEAEQNVNILLVDDRPVNLLALEAVLDNPAWNLIRAGSGDEALAFLRDDDFAAVLLDVNMPGMDGFKTAALMRKQERSQSTPILFITAARIEDISVSRGYALGAVDYIIKPFSPGELRSKVIVLVNLFRKMQNLEGQISSITRAEEKVNVLIVDDSPENLLTMEAALTDLGEHLVMARSGREALRHLLHDEFALILLDVRMPDMDGFETASLIRQNEKMQDIPILFVTVIHNAPEDVEKGYALGAMDYIFSPFNQEILRAKVKALVDLYRRSRTMERQLRKIEQLNWELTRSEVRFHHLNETLEQRVAERTAELQDKSEEVRAVSQQLWQAAKLATVGELAASIAHEINNPLATVSLRIESLLSQVTEDDPRHREMTIIEQEVDRIGNLVANLLQFSRRRQQHISTIDICEEIEGTLELIHYHLRNHRIAVVREFASDVPMVQADRQQMRQLFMNLFTNASDAMPKGGTLTIRVEE